MPKHMTKSPWQYRSYPQQEPIASSSATSYRRSLRVGRLTAVHPEGQSAVAVITELGQEAAAAALVAATATGVGDI